VYVYVCYFGQRTQEEVLHTDSNKEYAFDKTTSASCIFYTKTGWFPEFFRCDVPSNGSYTSKQHNSSVHNKTSGAQMITDIDNSF